jgi:glycosyltransferase involved in cell wall biosynthesis
MKKPKILHLITDLGIGGAEMILIRTLPLLTNFEHVICYFKIRDSVLVEKFEKIGIKVYPLRGKKFFFFKAILDFQRVVKSEKPDILVTYLIYADFFGRIFGRLFGIRKIICSILSSLDEKKYLPWLILNTVTSPLVTYFTTISESLKELYSKKWLISPKKIINIYTGINIEDFNKTVDISEKKEELKIPPKNYVIGCIGKLREEKGQKYLLEAIPKVLKVFPSLTLILVGGGNQRVPLEKLANDLGIKEKVLFLGDRQDVPEILKILDIFINPSFFEGMSIAILEAMASKCPIIASDIPPNREIVKNKKSGILVPAKDSRGLSEAIIGLLKNPDLRKKYGEETFSTAKTKFSIQEAIKNLDDFFQRVYRS